MPKAQKSSAHNHRYNPLNIPQQRGQPNTVDDEGAVPNSHTDVEVASELDIGDEDDSDDISATESAASQTEDEADTSDTSDLESDASDDSCLDIPECRCTACRQAMLEWGYDPDESSNESADETDTEPATTSQPQVNDNKGYLFRVSLMTMSAPKISRILRVPARLTFLEFHGVLQEAFDWDDCHAWKFNILTRRPESPTAKIRDVKELVIPAFAPKPGEERFTPEDVLKKTASAKDWTLYEVFDTTRSRWKAKIVSAVYTFDFGDNWEHTIDFMGVADDNLGASMGFEDPNQEAICVSGEGAPCVGDCGGYYGWEELKNLFKNPRMPDPGQRRQWYGKATLDPWKWDIVKVNRNLARLSHLDFDLEKLRYA